MARPLTLTLTNPDPDPDPNADYSKTHRKRMQSLPSSKQVRDASLTTKAANKLRSGLRSNTTRTSREDEAWVNLNPKPQPKPNSSTRT